MAAVVQMSMHPLIGAATLGGAKPDSRPRPDPAVSPAGAFPG